MLCFKSIINYAGFRRWLLVFALVTGYYVTAFAQQSVKGLVRDDAGKPLAGVTITVKGSDLSTISNSSGEYELNAADGNVLVFTYV